MIEFKCDENGQYKRVSFQQEIKNPEVVWQLMERFSTIFPDLEIFPISDMHLTYFHYGKPQGLFQDVRKFSDKLEFDTFLDGFKELLGEGIKNPVEDLVLPVDRVEIFGSEGNPILGLKLKRTGRLMRQRNPFSLQLYHFLRLVGVKDLKNCIEQSSNLVWEDLRYNPHISLGRLSSWRDIPEVDLLDMSVELSAPILKNAEIGGLYPILGRQGEAYKSRDPSEVPLDDIQIVS